MCKGDTFFARGHLWIVVTDETLGQVLIANVTTYEGKFDPDPSTILEAGDHPFITHKSFVYWEKAVLTSINQLDSLLKGGSIELYSPFSLDVLERIIEGGRKSDHLCGDYQRLL